MSQTLAHNEPAHLDEAQRIVDDVETGGRTPSNPVVAKLLIAVALTWSIFHVYVSSSFVLDFTPWMNADVVKRFHLIFAGLLAFLSYPAFKSSNRFRIPILDWVMGLLLALSAAYLIYQQVWNSSDFEMRLGDPNTWDVFFGVSGIVLLLEATRRSLGLPLVIIASLALIYAFLGAGDYAGASLNKLVSHQWITTEGVFGVAIGVSATMVFLFVLFGALLEQAGAGNYFTRVAFALIGHLRGGPAKAAVASSAMTGLISGSSIANVVTTGTFTIPLMKNVGFSKEKSGAIEVASSTNGQLMPPIMGAAAFLMVEYVGVPLVALMKHALLPALISYIALVYIVHLEALKADMQGLPRTEKMSRLAKLIGVLSIIIVISLFVWVVPPILNMIYTIAGQASIWLVGALLMIAYLALLYVASREPNLETSTLTELPPVGSTVRAGLHYLLPVAVLVWLLMVERFSPELSAFWAVICTMFIVVTQNSIIRFFRGLDFESKQIWFGLDSLKLGFVQGARNMIGIGVATAAAGIIVGTVTLTGIGQTVIGFVEHISGGNLMLVLIFTAVISLILGMGLPTTANYIVVSSLMAPVIVTLGAANDVAIPLIAAHLFVFYFGILADDTPPVGLAAFAAAAISKGDPIRTGIQGFTYDMRTAILPFFFIFNSQLLMIGVDSIYELVVVVVSSLAAMLLFAAVTQGYWLTKSRIWETLVLLACVFMLFRPSYIWDEIYPPHIEKPGAELFEVVDTMQPGERLQFMVSGETLEEVERTYTFTLPLAQGETSRDRFNNTGLQVDDLLGDMEIAMVSPGISGNKEIDKQVEAIKTTGVDSGWIITTILIENPRPPKQLVYALVIFLLALIAWLQQRRKNNPALLKVSR